MTLPPVPVSLHTSSGPVGQGLLITLPIRGVSPAMPGDYAALVSPWLLAPGTKFAVRLPAIGASPALWLRPTGVAVYRWAPNKPGVALVGLVPPAPIATTFVWFEDRYQFFSRVAAQKDVLRVLTDESLWTTGLSNIWEFGPTLTPLLTTGQDGFDPGLIAAEITTLDQAATGSGGPLASSGAPGSAAVVPPIRTVVGKNLLNQQDTLAAAGSTWFCRLFRID